LIERRGYMSVDALAAHFALTPQTIRRDVNDLCERGVLIRQHGGASLPLLNSSYRARHLECAVEKAAIARAVVDYLPDRATLFLPLGTTVEAVAEALAATDKTLTVVTNSTEVARIFWTRTSFETVLTGGVVQHRNGGLVGRRAVEVIGDYRCDYLICGVGGIELDGTLLDFYEAEIAVMVAMMANARRRLLVADHRKFGRVATQRLGALSDMHSLFTDAPPPPPLAAVAAKSGVEIVVADVAPEANDLPGAAPGRIRRTAD
jgi:DeoR family transcriptional regulator, glycerol-3-phosphate regulon repressor